MAAAQTSDASRYSTVAVVLHWTIAAAIIFMFILGWRMGDEPKGADTYALFQLHKSIGVTVMLLSLFRLGWRLTHRPVALPAAMPRWEALAAKVVHVAFYVLMIGMPLTGWLMVSASTTNIPTVLYGVVPWPHIPGVAEAPADIKRLAGQIGGLGHEVLAKSIYLLLPLHVAGALKHHFISRDGVVAAMIPGVRPGRRLEPRLILLAVLLAALVAGAYAWRSPYLKTAEAAPAVQVAPVVEAEPAPEAPVVAEAPAPAAEAEAAPAPEAAAEPDRWVVAPGSTLGFRTAWDGAPIEGTFKSWTADILFSPDALDRSRVRVSVDVSAVDTGDGQRDGAIPGPEWLDGAAHPRAVFAADRFRALGGDRYEAQGRLTLRGVSRPVSLAFTLKIDGDKARMRGVTSLDRTRFGVGQGEWASTDSIPAQVGVTVDLTATRR